MTWGNSAKKLKPSLIAASGALLGISAGIAVIAGVSASMRTFITNTIEAEKVTSQLGAVVKSTGGAAGFTVRELQKQASALQSITTYGDEAIQEMQGLLLTFTKIRGNEFEDATLSVLNVATAMGTDLKSAAIQVGKALNDPILGVTALARSGIQFSESQKEVIKSLVETNQLAEAQKIILNELDVQFAGSAAAARKTLGGALTALGNAWGDLFEVGGPASEGLRKAVEDLIEEINSPEFKEAIAAIGEGLFTVLKRVGEYLPVLVTRIGDFIGAINSIPSWWRDLSDSWDRFGARVRGEIVTRGRGGMADGQTSDSLDRLLSTATARAAESNSLSPLTGYDLANAFRETETDFSKINFNSFEDVGGGGGKGNSRSIKDVIQELKDEAFALSLSENAQKAYNLAKGIGAEYGSNQYNAILSEVEILSELETRLEDVKNKQEEWNKGIETANNLILDGLSGAIDGLIDGTKNLSESFKDLAKNIAKAVINGALFGTGGLGGLFGGGIIWRAKYWEPYP
jgi:hypothetical protein